MGQGGGGTGQAPVARPSGDGGDHGACRACEGEQGDADLPEGEGRPGETQGDGGPEHAEGSHAEGLAGRTPPQDRLLTQDRPEGGDQARIGRVPGGRRTGMRKPSVTVRTATDTASSP